MPSDLADEAESLSGEPEAAALIPEPPVSEEREPESATPDLEGPSASTGTAPSHAAPEEDAATTPPLASEGSEP